MSSEKVSYEDAMSDRADIQYHLKVVQQVLKIMDRGRELARSPETANTILRAGRIIQDLGGDLAERIAHLSTINRNNEDMWDNFPPPLPWVATVDAVRDAIAECEHQPEFEQLGAAYQVVERVMVDLSSYHDDHPFYQDYGSAIQELWGDEVTAFTEIHRQERSSSRMTEATRASRNKESVERSNSRSSRNRQPDASRSRSRSQQVAQSRSRHTSAGSQRQRNSSNESAR